MHDVVDPDRYRRGGDDPAYMAAVGEQLERGDRVHRGLPDDGLSAVLAHRPLVVDYVIDVDGLWIAGLIEALHIRAGAGLALHLGAKSRWVGQCRCEQIAR